MAAPACGSEHYTSALASFEDIEETIGELAAYVSDIADALSRNPDALVSALTDSWPDRTTLLQLRSNWAEQRAALISAWQTLSPSLRLAHPLPPFDAIDRARPIV